jgi:hypothetical protein
MTFTKESEFEEVLIFNFPLKRMEQPNYKKIQPKPICLKIGQTFYLIITEIDFKQ